MKILFVCYGNICRSPLAEGILQHKANEAGLHFDFDSAATSGWHIGEKPDRRAIKTAALNGIDISYQRARQVQRSDFKDFDMIVAMDRANYADLLKMSDEESDRQKVHLFMNIAYPDSHEDVHDPYYDGTFQEVFNVIDKAGDIIIENFKKKS